MMKKILLFALAGISFSAFCAVNIELKKTQKGTREYNNFKVLNSAPVKYSVDYNISERKGKKFV